MVGSKKKTEQGEDVGGEFLCIICSNMVVPKFNLAGDLKSVD